MFFYYKMPNRVDFLPILSPSNGIKGSVSNWKLDCSLLVGKYPGMKGTAHITMRDDLMNKDFALTEQSLMAYEKKLRLQYSIDLCTNGFDFFKGNSGNTIYLAMRSDPLYKIWFKELTQKLNNKRKHFTPHITITKSIDRHKFDRLWPKFDKSQHNQTFRVDRLTVLKRETFDKESNYEIFNEFPFKNEVFNEEIASKQFTKKYLNACFPNTQLSLF